MRRPFNVEGVKILSSLSPLLVTWDCLWALNVRYLFYHSWFLELRLRRDLPGISLSLECSSGLENPFCMYSSCCQHVVLIIQWYYTFLTFSYCVLIFQFNYLFAGNHMKPVLDLVNPQHKWVITTYSRCSCVFWWICFCFFIIS